MDKDGGKDWATNYRHPQALFTHEYEDSIICLLTETKASHNIPWSYRHAMSTNPN